MKTYLQSASTVALTLSLALLSSLSWDNAVATEVPAKGAAKAPPLNIRSVPDVPLPQSVFTIPTQPTEGRNPFFPQSIVRVVPPKITGDHQLDTSWLVLNGITSPPKRTAMINGRTFEAGEEGEVRIPSGGKILIKCEEIRAESAIIEVGGQRRELRFRTGL